MTTQHKSRIKAIEDKLSKLAIAQGLSSMEIRILFLLERAVSRMSVDQDLHRSLIFKGGFVSLRVYGSKRFTMDVDAALNGISQDVAIQKIKVAMAQDIRDGTWFTFEGLEEVKARGEYGGLSLKFRAGLGEPPTKIQRALRISIDIGIGDPVTPKAISAVTPLSLGDGALSWQVYPIESMIAEKLHALLFFGNRNSRSKDIYDLDFFWDKADPKDLRVAIEKTFAFRDLDVPASMAEAIAAIDTTVLKRGWASATATVRPKVGFDDTLASLLRKVSIF